MGNLYFLVGFSNRYHRFEDGTSPSCIHWP
jgi:hypothetical protein